jgi:hypothetical protein
LNSQIIGNLPQSRYVHSEKPFKRGLWLLALSSTIFRPPCRVDGELVAVNGGDVAGAESLVKDAVAG